MEADHRGINKFESDTDPNYLKVLEKLKKLVDSAPEVSKRVAAPSLPTARWPVPGAGSFVHQAAPGEGFRVIPYGQNDKFTGRESVSAQLRRLLSKSGH